jgi:hypothetical protein
METYKNINEFIKEVFPQENEKIIKRKKSNVVESIEELDSEFDEKLKEILKGKSE